MFKYHSLIHTITHSPSLSTHTHTHTNATRATHVTDTTNTQSPSHIRISTHTHTHALSRTERERTLQKNLGSSWDSNPDLPNASRMLLPLSHWTYGRGAETRTHIATLVRGLSQFQLTFSLTVDCTACDKVEIPCWMELRAWVYSLYKHIA